MKKFRKLISLFMAVCMVCVASVSAVAAAEDPEQEQEYDPPGYGADGPADGVPFTYGKLANEMTDMELRREGVKPPLRGLLPKATYNQYGYVHGALQYAVYTSPSGIVEKGYINPRARVYVFNNDAYTGRYYIRFVNNGKLDTGYVNVGAIRVPDSGWTRPITTGTFGTDYRLNVHNGIDIAAPAGTGVYAVKGVSHSSKHMLGEIDGKTRLVNYGNYIVCTADGVEVIYAHLSSFERGAVSTYSTYSSEFSGQTQSPVAATWTPSKGAKIGGVGSTGWSTGNHLHFEVRSATNYKEKKDPFLYVVFPFEG